LAFSVGQLEDVADEQPAEQEHEGAQEQADVHWWRWG
jgi:hypothetical protein